jgi:predicted HicB family RNase H-like nuclease
MTPMIPKIPKLKTPNSKDRLVIYLPPQIKKVLNERAKSMGQSVTKFVEKIIRDSLGV